MAKKKNKTVWAVVGFILTIFGVIGTIPLALGREYLYGILITGLAVIIGVILIAWALSD